MSARISALSALFVALATGLATSVAIGAMTGRLIAAPITYWLFAWPLLFLAHMAGRQWVGVSPTPLLDALFGAQEPRRWWIGPAWGAIVAVPLVALSLLSLLFVAPEVTDRSGLPFADMSAQQIFLANTLIVAEEVIFRLFIMFLVVALLGLRNARRGDLPAIRVWIAILVSGVLFALAHMGNAAAIGSSTEGYLVFALVQKGLIGGTLLGLVAWRWGVESSIVCHYTSNLLFLGFAGLASS